MTHPLLGAKAPDFVLSNQYGESLSLADLDSSPVLVVFFPLAFTPVCEGELSALAQHSDGFARRGVRVVGISVDHRYALRDAAERLGVGFDLLSDFWPHGAVSQAFCAFDQARGHSTRQSFLLDERGVVRHTFFSERGAPRPLTAYFEAIDAVRRP